MTVALLLAALDASDDELGAIDAARTSRSARAAHQGVPHAARAERRQEGTDAELLARTRTNDADAFATLFTRHAPTLTLVAAAVVQSADVADDVVQAVMLRLWQRRETIHVAGDIAAYLRSAVYNEAKNVLTHDTRLHRRAERAVSFGETQLIEAQSPEEDMAARELADTVRAAIDALPARTGEIFRLWLYSDLSYAEIANTLGISVKGVEQGRARALAMLRNTLLPQLRNR